MNLAKPRIMQLPLGRIFSCWLVCCLVGFAQAAPQTYSESAASPAAELQRTYAYPADLLESFQRVPVQEDGRIKPMDTFAGFKLLKFNSKRSLSTAGLAVEDKLTPAGWMLDCILFPEQARTYRVFIVPNKELVTAMGLDPGERKKRDRFSFNELETVRNTMRGLAVKAGNVESQQRTRDERQVTVLWRNFVELEDLLRAGSFVGVELPTGAVPGVGEVYQGRDVELPMMLARAKTLMENRPTDAQNEAWIALQDRYGELVHRNGLGIGFFPPDTEVDQRGAWSSWPELASGCLEGDTVAQAKLPLLEAFGKMVKAKDDPASLTQELNTFLGLVQARAEARGEYAKVPMEVKFYSYDFFYRALYCFVIAFLLVALSALGGSSRAALWKWLVRGAWALTVLGLVLLTVGITYRCILRSRPPISTLYETILFIAATGVLVALILEHLFRYRVALTLATLMGAWGMFIAHRYELREAVTAGDTMPALQAVLDTNYWLATHVTIINLGYMAGLLGAFLAHVWLILHFKNKTKHKHTLTEITRMTYGILCFCLLFSVVGTILGGVWANDSWGRFWGWDPKENGALLICIWGVLILHARMGGFIRNFGFALMNIALGMVVATSWWGVNLLEIGLHSYGFTEGVGFWLMTFYAIEGGVILLALIGRMFQGDGGPKIEPASNQ